MEKTTYTIPRLTRLTTVYHPVEDRIRISGEIGEEKVAVVWLTRRMTDQLVAALIQFLEKQQADIPRGDLLNTLQQAKARQAHQERSKAGQEPPVSPDNPDQEWLVVSVDLQQQPAGYRLIFKDAAKAFKQSVALDLPTVSLRQWLGVLLIAYQSAKWPQEIWPDWMVEDGDSSEGVRQKADVALH